MADKFSHIDDQGNAKMVDISNKEVVHRIATACGDIQLAPATIELIKQNNIVKGDVLTVAKIAGIQAAKQTSNLIPLCHNLLIHKVDIEFEMLARGVRVCSTVKCDGKTGVEMEALNAVSIALLTIYDMCKAVDKEMIISNISLKNKEKNTITTK